MEMFDHTIQELRAYTAAYQAAEVVREFEASRSAAWPPAAKREIILKADLGLELGNPTDESTTFLVWTRNLDLVRHNRITLIGPDVPETDDQNLPFGKAVILAGRDFDEINSYDRFRQMSQVRFDLSLKGYMLRAVSQYGREWGRISRKARDGGFSFSILGRALVDQFTHCDFVEKVEIVLVTLSTKDVRRLREIGARAERYIMAMTKMAEEWSFDCSSCDYQGICSQVSELKAMKKQLTETKMK
jgi:CO dehydrogenase/acetyl-CoA synthase beta subunit